MLITIFIFIIFVIIFTDPNINETILILVSEYFYTFRYCWNKTLITLTILIDKYIDFLNNMVVLLTNYPMNIISCITVICLLLIVYFIIKIIYI